MDRDPLERLVPGIETELRAFVAAAGSRRALPLTAYAGVPGGERSDFPGAIHGAVGDDGLRADLVERALDGIEDLAGACVWVSRPGPFVPGDLEVAWRRAAHEGFARHGLVLPAYVVLNRYGWHDLVSGRERTWYRVRPRRRVGRGAQSNLS